MKQLLTIAFFFLLSFVYGQDEAASVKFNNSKITELSFTVDDLTELKTINWKDIKEMVNTNKSSDSITLGFKVKGKSKKSSLKYKHSVQVKGKTEDINGVIAINKRMIKILENL